jgi:uncharacterized protein YaiI (UPF0178 family)
MAGRHQIVDVREISRELFYQSLVTGEAKLACSVVAKSIVAMVQTGNRYRNHLLSRTRQIGRSMHHGFVERLVGRERARGKRCNFEGVGQGPRLVSLRPDRSS